MNNIKRTLVALLCVWSLQAAAQPLSLAVRGHPVQHDLFTLFAHPGEELRVEVLSPAAPGVQLYMDGRPHGSLEGRHWVMRAPRSPGLYHMRMTHAPSGAETVLNLMVGSTTAEVEGDLLNGYRLGPAPPPHSKYPSYYRQPELFFEVTAENVDTSLSPHFTLRQFLCKQSGDYPKYVVLRESLLVLLEGLVEAVQQAGYAVDSFGVISGYRTPFYNRAIGNVPNSRHVYGDAMDFFVDQDGDGRMDDLNGDGEHNNADVDLLYRIVHEFKDRPQNRLLIGGVGRYYKTAHHGGFVHVDARGFRARW